MDMIQNEEAFNHSLPASYDGQFDWDMLLPIFQGTKLSFSDIDSILEKNGKFIIFETKKIKNSIPRGQSILLNRLHSKGDITLVYIFFDAEDKNNDNIMMVQVKHENETEFTSHLFIGETKNDGKQFLYDLVSSWYNKAINIP